MKIEEFDTVEKMKTGIERRAEAMRSLEPFVGWHFSKTVEYRRNQRNLERLKAKLLEWEEKKGPRS